MIKYMKAKDFRQINGHAKGIHFIDADDNHVIELPYNASTKTKLHELGHQYHDHQSGNMTYQDLFNREVQAELYAYTKMDKVLNYKVLFSAIYNVAVYNYLKASDIMVLALAKLKEFSIPLDRWDKSELWDMIKEEVRK